VTNDDQLEQLRQSFRPPSIITLFVGESPPAGDSFFYKERGLLYRSMREAFGNIEDFLAWFKASGFFLDDLVLDPINRIKDKKERDTRRHQGIVPLAKRISAYRPQAIVVLMCAIKDMVREAKTKSGVDAPLYVTPFPRPEHQRHFKNQMASIIPKLPTASPHKDNST